MTKEELQINVAETFPAAVLDGVGEWLSMNIGPAEWLDAAKKLRNNPEFQFDYLFCMTAVDWKTHLSLVCHLTSTIFRHTLVVKIKISDRDKAEVESVSGIWKTAEFHELEAYDLMGIHFLNHPGLRRLFLTEDWKGWPLRKDYEDPINMIEL